MRACGRMLFFLDFRVGIRFDVNNDVGTVVLSNEFVTDQDQVVVDLHHHTIESVGDVVLVEWNRDHHIC